MRRQPSHLDLHFLQMYVRINLMSEVTIDFTLGNALLHVSCSYLVGLEAYTLVCAFIYASAYVLREISLAVYFGVSQFR